MADIELVIRIDEEDYNIMKHNVSVDNPLCPLSQREMVTKIANGTPLPKGYNDKLDKISEEVDGLKNYSYPFSDMLLDDVQEIINKYKE